MQAWLLFIGPLGTARSRILRTRSTDRIHFCARPAFLRLIITRETERGRRQGYEQNVLTYETLLVNYIILSLPDDPISTSEMYCLHHQLVLFLVAA